MIVVDSNVLAYLYVAGEFTAAAESLFERDPDWVAPILWRSEFRNIMAGYIRRKGISFEQATALQAEAESLLAGCEFEVESQAVLELVRDSDCSAYDCEFVALAMKLNVLLVTMDKKLLRAFPNRAVGLSLGIRQ
jgi:predicted nucleic acid-binding protein